MKFDEFEHLARLHVIGALEPADRQPFEHARKHFGEQAEAFLKECRRLNAVLALSLQPLPPSSETRERLLKMISQRNTAFS